MLLTNLLYNVAKKLVNGEQRVAVASQHNTAFIFKLCRLKVSLKEAVNELDHFGVVVHSHHLLQNGTQRKTRTVRTWESVRDSERGRRKPGGEGERD